MIGVPVLCVEVYPCKSDNVEESRILRELGIKTYKVERI